MSLIGDVENTQLCMEIAITECLCVWQFLSFDQVKQHYHELQSGRGRDDVIAILLTLIAIGSRYIDRFDPSCGDGIVLFRNAKDRLDNISNLDISPTLLQAVYVMVLWLKLRYSNPKGSLSFSLVR